jgi:alkylated DNA repair protein (DNA oxidative demethylase)
VARTRAVTEEPAGLVYRPDFVTPDEEERLLAFLEELDFNEVVMHGQAARRTVRHYGFDYAYESRTATPGEPIPDTLVELRDRCAELGGVEPEALAEALVTRYPPGAGIGWHRDAPMFGSPVVGVSLGSACRMRFQRTAGGVRRTFALELEPRSAYALGGAARWAWQHSIPLTSGRRYSVTFRTLREREGAG